MLQIVVSIGPEGWDEKRNEFVAPRTQTLQLEHSLLSLSKWESKWHKAFLGKQEKTSEETIDYIRCMAITSNVSQEIFEWLSDENIKAVNQYIQDPMTATTFSKIPGGNVNRETVTSELIYYWMITLNIPFECQKWHLNRLLALIRVCNIKNSPPRKRGRRELLTDYARLNAERRKQYHTKG